MTDHRIIQGDVLNGLRILPDKSVHSCITSPSYYGENEPIRDYKVEGQIGFEDTLNKYKERLRPVFKEAYRVLRDDGTLFLNLGFTFDGKGNCIDTPHAIRDMLVQDGWYFKCPIVWEKPNVMPASPTKRPVLNHEMIFLLTKDKGTDYYFDHIAIEEPCSESYLNEKRPPGILRQRLYPNSKYLTEDYGSNQFKHKNLIPHGQSPNTMHIKRAMKQDLTGNPTYTGFNERWDKREDRKLTRNARTIWRITNQARLELHFASFPDELATRCIKAGTSEKGCCPKCGVQWERVIEKEKIDRSLQSKKEIELEIHPARKTLSRCNSASMVPLTQKTIRWQPACNCKDVEPIPCTVLDFFGGRGTTGIQANKLGRNSIMIELSPIYIKLIRRNMQADEQLDTGIVNYRFEKVTE